MWRVQPGLAGLAEDLDIPLSEKIARITKGSMTMEVNSANLDFLSSTLTKVSEWAQDEISPTPSPWSHQCEENLAASH